MNHFQSKCFKNRLACVTEFGGTTTCIDISRNQKPQILKIFFYALIK